MSTKQKQTEIQQREQAARLADKLILFQGNSNFYEYNGKRLKWFVQKVKAGEISHNVACLALYLFEESLINWHCDEIIYYAEDLEAYKTASLGCRGGNALLDIVFSATRPRNI